MLCVAPHSRSYLSDTLDIKNIPKSTKVEPVPLTLSFTSILFFFFNENAYEKENYGAQNYWTWL